MKNSSRILCSGPGPVPAALLLLVLLGTGGCGDEEGGGGREKEIDPWREKVEAYPVEVPFIEDRGRPLFDFSRSRVVTMMVRKLDGASSRQSFEHIRAAFARVPADECVPPLRDALDRLAAASAHTRGILQNTCEACGFVGDPRLVPALKRAAMVRESPGSTLFHKGVQRAAVAAIGRCATVAQAEDLWHWFLGRGGQKGPGIFAQWHLVGALVRIDPEGAPRRLGAILADSALRQPLEAVVLEHVQKLPAKDLAPVMIRFFDEFYGQNKLILARLLHLGGYQQGSDYLLEQLQKAEVPGARAMIVQALGKAEGRKWTEEVLPFASDPAVEVQLALITAVEDKPEKTVDDTLEVLANSPRPMVRREALRALRKRGSTAMLDQLLRDLAQSTGSRRRSLLNDLLYARETRVMPIINELLPRSKGAERFQLMRVLGTMADPAGIDPLLRVFREPRHELRPQVTNLVYAARMLSNIPAAAPRLMQLVTGEFSEDTERRYRCLATLARIATLDQVGEDQRREIKTFLLDHLGKEKTDPRDRLVLCRLLLPFLGLDDVMDLKRIMLRSEDPRVKRGISRFLWDFYGRPAK